MTEKRNVRPPSQKTIQEECGPKAYDTSHSSSSSPREDGASGMWGNIHPDKPREKDFCVFFKKGEPYFGFPEALLKHQQEWRQEWRHSASGGLVQSLKWNGIHKKRNYLPPTARGKTWDGAAERKRSLTWGHPAARDSSPRAQRNKLRRLAVI